MWRLIACLLFLASPSEAAAACDMRSDSRASAIADYIENGNECLIAPSEGFVFDAAMEAHFVERINAERVSRGLPALLVRAGMKPAARFHSLDMGTNGFFGHKTPAGVMHPTRIAAFDRTLLADFTAENVAKEERLCMNRTQREIPCQTNWTKRQSRTVDQLHRNLMNSPGHRANILSPRATHIALGVARRDGGVYVTQLFASPVGELDTPLPVRFDAGSRILTEVRLPDWTFGRFVLNLSSGRADLKSGHLPLDLHGSAELVVRAERKGKATVTRTQILQPIEFIYLPGPAFTITPPPQTAAPPTRAS